MKRRITILVEDQVKMMMMESQAILTAGAGMIGSGCIHLFLFCPIVLSLLSPCLSVLELVAQNAHRKFEGSFSPSLTPLAVLSRTFQICKENTEKWSI